MITNGNSKISGVGSFIPSQRVLTSELLDEVKSIDFGTPINYINRRIGIESVHYSETETRPSDMAIEASIKAIEDAGIEPKDIDLVIYCGIDRDWQEPATSHRVQNMIGAYNSSCFDVSNACHGFMNGISIADMYIASNCIQTALICTGEKPSEIAHYVLNKSKTCRDKAWFRSSLGSLTTGDAGGAMIIQRSDGITGFKSMQFSSKGQHAELCYYKRSGGGIVGQMLMKEISREINSLHSEIIDDTYSILGWAPNDVDTAFCHQVGAMPHKMLTETARLSPEVAPITYKHYGNLTSATIPVIMDLNPPQKGDNILFMGTGSGLSVCQAGMVF